MENVSYTKEEMLGRRVSLYKDLTPSHHAFVDSHLPGHHKSNHDIIGRGVTENPAGGPAISEPHDFAVHLVKAPSNNGAALHSHDTVEVFMSLAGKWKVYWDNNGENCEIVLGKWDVISVPPGVYRGFENLSGDDAVLLVIMGGEDSGRVSWAPEVVAAATAIGAEFNPDGTVRSPPK